MSPSTMMLLRDEIKSPSRMMLLRYEIKMSPSTMMLLRDEIKSPSRMMLLRDEIKMFRYKSTHVYIHVYEQKTAPCDVLEEQHLHRTQGKINALITSLQAPLFTRFFHQTTTTNSNSTLKVQNMSTAWSNTEHEHSLE
jgi:hypothetical protein